MLLKFWDDCPNELEADLRQNFGLRTRDMKTEGVAYIAALSATLGQGSKVFGFYDPAYGWSRQELLTARLIDEFRLFEWGLGGKKQTSPELITPHPKDEQQSSTSGERHIGVSVPIEVIDKLFLQGGDG